MEYLAVLPIGFLIGMGHALEADHLAAVTTLQKNRDGRFNIFARGAIWGLGHTISLLVACLAVFLLGVTISGQMEAALELAVGIMIIGLGGHLLWRMKTEKIHIHAHEHDGSRHIHVHSHRNDSVPHSKSAHEHSHKAPLVSGKKFVFSVGLMHGLAGSAGFLILVSATAKSLWQMLSYLTSFGLGTILGMGVLTLAISLPLGKLHTFHRWMPTAANVAIAVVAILFGGMLAIENLHAFVG